MAGQLLLRLREKAPDSCEWRVVDPDGTARRGAGTLGEAAALAAGRRTTVLVPAASVLLTETRVPSRKPQHIRQAVPYLLEEQLADDVAALHFAIGERAADGLVAVAVIDRQLLAGWLAALTEAGIGPLSVVPEMLALPWSNGDWTLADGGDGLLLRTGATAGMAVDAVAAPQLLAALASGGTPPERLVVLGPEAAELAAAWLESRPAAARPSVLAVDQPLIESMSSGLAERADRLDLLQGEFAPDAGSRARWYAWRRPVALAATLLLLWFAGRLLHVQQLEGESRVLDAAMVATFRDAFPENTRVVDPYQQLRARLAQRGDGDQARFLDLLATAGEALARQTQWQLAGLSFRDGALQLQLKMPAFDHFERLREQFDAATGVQAEVGSLGSVDGEVRGSVTLRRSGT